MAAGCSRKRRAARAARRRASERAASARRRRALPSRRRREPTADRAPGPRGRRARGARRPVRAVRRSARRPSSSGGWMWSTSRLPPGSLRRSRSETVCIMSSDEWRWKYTPFVAKGRPYAWSASIRSRPARNTASDAQCTAGTEPTPPSHGRGCSDRFRSAHTRGRLRAARGYRYRAQNG